MNSSVRRSEPETAGNIRARGCCGILSLSTNVLRCHAFPHVPSNCHVHRLCYCDHSSRAPESDPEIAVTGDQTTQRVPLYRFPLLSAGAPEATRHNAMAPGPMTPGPMRPRGDAGLERLCYPGEFTAAGNFVRLKTMGLAYLSYSSRVRVHCSGVNAIRQQFCLHGSAVTSFGSQQLLVDPDRPSLIPAGAAAIYDFEKNFTQLVLYVDAAALRSTLSALIGIPLDQAITFATPTDSQKPELQGLRQLVRFLVSELDREDCQLSDFGLAELEQTLLVSFLHANPHNFSHLLERDLRRAAPWQVRRAEEFIEANWNRPLTIKMISAATGVSIRNLIKAFRLARGCSPMAFVKRVRLMQARQMLTAPAENTSVTAVAFACGFDNPGHFAGDYRLAFGELPSQTLTKVKGPAYQSYTESWGTRIEPPESVVRTP
jgi:AraC-like DNA-binding protein